MPDSPNTLVAGVTKWIRLFDIRTQNQNPKLIAHTKAIYGICIDPNNPSRLASFAKGQKGVVVWDVRKPEKPIVTINQTNPVLKVQWCPKRSHMISVLQKDSNAVKYYDLQFSTSLQYNSNVDVDNDSILFERNIMLPKSTSSTVSSYDWNPDHEMTLLAVTKTGSLHYLKVFERIAMSWSPSSEVMWACGSQMFLSDKPDPSMQDDISFVMKKRAEQGYGEAFVMKDDRKLNDVLNEPALFNLWTWLKRAKKLKDHDQRKVRKFFGVKAIIKGDLSMEMRRHKAPQTPTSREMAPSFPQQNQNSKEGRNLQTLKEEKIGGNLIATQYSNDDRKLALFLCEWDVTDETLRERLDQLVAKNEIERAAAVALFHNKLDWTIDILGSTQANQKKELPIVAMALSGYNDSIKKGSMWIANCQRLGQQLTNPYLRAMFAFLTAEGEDFTSVLKENGMDLKDRIAFACRYLSDAKLTNYVENVTSKMITSGGLEGLLLTGLTTDGIDLLENYITKYGDVQTAVLIVLVMKYSDVMKDERVNDWIEYYRCLLDRWRMWHKRAQFDSLVQSMSLQRKIPNQISVTCTYCSKPVSLNMMAAGGLRSTRFLYGGAGGANRQNKAMSCPGCRQPLPRCSVCLINMGSLSTHQPRTGNQKPKLENNVNSFQNWFTWCQMCRHGGHAAHLADWFVDHVECPVTSCNCVCNALDRVSMVTPQELPVKKISM
uniref:WD repeat protein mio zinc-ribbon like domain-containing protein n=2 Tax=Clytia hemisphaerica TaxID=252671 RepID=A0A7M5WX31_9CNID